MVRELMKDTVFLAQKAQPATADDIPTADDLLDTLRELAELPGNYRNKARRLFRAADAGRQLYMARIKAGFADEE